MWRTLVLCGSYQKIDCLELCKRTRDAPSSPAIMLLARGRHWLSLVVGFLSFQTATQLLGFATGLVAVRLLAVAGFGRYSIAVAVQGTVSILADIGVNSAVSALGGKIFHDPKRFGELITCALSFRRRLLGPALAVGTVTVVYLLRQTGATYAEAAFVSVGLMLAVHSQVTYSVYSVVPLLGLRYQEVQYVNIAGAVFRGVFITLTVWLTRSYLWAVGVAALSMVLQAQLMKRAALPHLAPDVKVQKEDEQAISAIFKSQIVTAVYYAFAPQLTVLLLSWFGSVERVAEVGALARLTIIFAAFEGLLANLIGPRFARLHGSVALRTKYLQTVVAMALLALGLFILTWLFPFAALWLLGPKYSHLSKELVLMVASSGCNLVITTMAILNISRAWSRGSWLYVPGAILTQIVLLQFLDLRTVRGAILFGWGSLISPAVTGLILGVRGIRAERRGELQVSLTETP